MKNQNLAQNKTLALAMHKSSHSIAKMKPKIRVIHLQNPQVIEIEPADFQKFAQSLTGNTIETSSKHNKLGPTSNDVPIILCDESSNTEMETCPKDNFSPSHAKGFAFKYRSKPTSWKKENLSQNITLALAMDKGSQSIANTKPQVRIAHIPKAREIEPADFQKVVQSLTGKPSAMKIELKKPEHSSKKVPIILCDEPSSSAETDILNEFRSCLVCDEPSSSIEMDIQNEFRSCLEHTDGKTTDEEEMTSWENLSDESIIGFEDLDKFINELIDFNCFL